jgi:hypothetical protein
MKCSGCSTIAPLVNVSHSVPIISRASAFGLYFETHLPAAVVAEADTQMTPLRDVVCPPPVWRNPEILNQQTANAHRCHRHHRRNFIHAVLLPPAPANCVARNRRLMVQVVTVDAVETASVQASLGEEGKKVVAEQDICVGNEQPLPPCASESNILSVELQECEMNTWESSWGYELGERGRGGGSSGGQQLLGEPG